MCTSLTQIDIRFVASKKIQEFEKQIASLTQEVALLRSSKQVHAPLIYMATVILILLFYVLMQNILDTRYSML